MDAATTAAAAALQRQIDGLAAQRTTALRRAEDQLNDSRFADGCAAAYRALAGEARRAASGLRAHIGETPAGACSVDGADRVSPLAPAVHQLSSVRGIVEGGWVGESADAFMAATARIPDAVNGAAESIRRYFTDNATNCEALAAAADAKALDFSQRAVEARRIATAQRERASSLASQMTTMQGRIDTMLRQA